MDILQAPKELLQNNYDESKKKDQSRMTRILLQNFDKLEWYEREYLFQQKQLEEPRWETIREKQDRLMRREQFRNFITNRHNLNYAKLFHNVNGGYTQEQLAKVLRRIQGDLEDGIGAPFDSEGEDMEEDLEEVVRRHFEEKGEEAKEEPGEDEVDEDGNKLKSVADLVLEVIEDEEERELVRKIMIYIKDKKTKQMKEDIESGELVVEEKPMYSLKELNQMVEFWKEESGHNW